MAYKKSSTTDITLRIAMAMKQMGIDGLPRNYELVYEAYAGGNPDLVRDFIALGKFKTQAALDVLAGWVLGGTWMVCTVLIMDSMARWRGAPAALARQ